MISPNNKGSKFKQGMRIQQKYRKVSQDGIPSYRRIGLSGAHLLFSAHRLLGACCLLDKICLDH